MFLCDGLSIEVGQEDLGSLREFEREVVLSLYELIVSKDSSACSAIAMHM